ncbi:hypothetical protein GC101_15705 [Paenibacillus sp. LMG 31459]|uniref:Secreted protein n=1 Tax=Paenibacillus phytohabitans TaxID=2654978 RepID=A0ABX1YJL1_9BACL|nr:hypothetical protein [Paenibacillus phytohabitans]
MLFAFAFCFLLFAFCFLLFAFCFLLCFCFCFCLYFPQNPLDCYIGCRYNTYIGRRYSVRRCNGNCYNVS